jgi:hypothetical protein
MNEMNERDTLEARLGFWKPRRPSAGLERRLFRRAAARPGWAWLAGWLAPAAACLLFAALALNPHDTATLPGRTPSGGMLAVILSNQNYAAYLPGGFPRAHNQLERFPKPVGGSGFTFTNLAR